MQRLADELENILAEEARRVYTEIYNRYTRKSGSDRPFFDLVDVLISDKMRCFGGDIRFRVIQLIPENLTITNDARIFVEQSTCCAQAQEAKRKRQDELEAATLIAQSSTDQSLPRDIIDLLSLIASDLTTADGQYLIQAIAVDLERDHQLVLKQLRPLVVEPCS